MIEWEEERIIHQNIDKVWTLFADANIKKSCLKLRNMN